MKNKLFIVIVILIIGLIAGGLLLSQNKTSEKQSDAVRFHQSYPSVPENNKFVYATNEEVLDIFNKGTGLIFLGFPGCPWCQKLAPLVNEAASQSGLEKIYYLNIQEARNNNDELYQKLVEFLKDDLQKDENGNPRIYVPDVTAVSGGEIAGRFKQEKADGTPTPDEFWTETRKNSAVKQLKELIEKMNQSKFSQIENEVKNGEATLIDVRSPEEFKSGHFAKAINLDVEEIYAGKLPEKPKDSKIYVYCRSGNRSTQATNLLEDAGFTDVNDLGGLTHVQEMGGKLITN